MPASVDNFGFWLQSPNVSAVLWTTYLLVDRLHEKGFICSCSSVARFHVTALFRSWQDFQVVVGGRLWPCWLYWFPAFVCCFAFLPVASLTGAACSDADGRAIPIDVYLDKKCCHWIATEAIYGILMHSVIACQENSLFLTAFSNQVVTIKFSFGVHMCLATICLNSLVRKFGIHCLSTSIQYYIISSTQILASY